MPTINKSRISASLPAYLVDEMRDIAEIENKSQSSIVEQALKAWFRARLDADSKYLATLSFPDLPTEDEWLAIGSKIK